MTPNDAKLFEYWSIKKRDASGKRPRPCDTVVTLSDGEIKELMKLPPSQRRTAAQLKAAEQAQQ